jgi:hypothetical protein
MSKIVDRYLVHSEVAVHDDEERAREAELRHERGR